MFGGNGQGYLVCVHGSNSITPNAIIIEGIYTDGYNIARGANGDSTGNIKYFKGAKAIQDTYNMKPTYSIEVLGSCSTARETMCSILSAKLDFLKH